MDAGLVTLFITLLAMGPMLLGCLLVGIGKLTNKGLSAEEWRRLRQQHII